MRIRAQLPALVLAALAAAALRAAPITPETLPDPGIAGFRFPESEATLTRWITEMTRGDATTAAAARDRVYLHGWALWAAVTAQTAQFSQGQPLRVFETWLAPDDLLNADGSALTPAVAAPRGRAPLQPLAQFTRPRFVAEPSERDEPMAEAEVVGGRALGFVKFDPTAAAHMQRQELLHTAALDALLQGGAQQIPAFPSSAVVVKPLFLIAKQSELAGGRYYPLKVWSGPPETPQPSLPAQWSGRVWLDVLGAGAGRAIDLGVAGDGSSRTDATTFPLASVIHYRLSADDAAAINASTPATGASAGDFALLVAMHVATREIARWTWQTFWWTPLPDAPPAPSSSDLAAARPPELVGPARHYAMAVAYSMLSPEQPYIGGENATPAVYAYNPWIEARFGAADLPDSRAGLAPDGRAAANNVGVQTNCMSCHAQATYNPARVANAPRFTGARYVDLADPQFVGTLQVDFLWSVARRAK